MRCLSSGVEATGLVVGTGVEVEAVDQVRDRRARVGRRLPLEVHRVASRRVGVGGRLETGEDRAAWSRCRRRAASTRTARAGSSALVTWKSSMFQPGTATPVEARSVAMRKRRRQVCPAQVAIGRRHLLEQRVRGVRARSSSAAPRSSTAGSPSPRRRSRRSVWSPTSIQVLPPSSDSSSRQPSQLSSVS